MGVSGCLLPRAQRHLMCNESRKLASLKHGTRTTGRFLPFSSRRWTKRRTHAPYNFGMPPCWIPYYGDLPLYIPIEAHLRVMDASKAGRLHIKYFFGYEQDKYLISHISLAEHDEENTQKGGG